MARQKVRGRPGKKTVGRARMKPEETIDAMTGSLSRLFMDTVEGVETAAAGALRFARNTVVPAVTGVAGVAADAFTATTAGARAIVSTAAAWLGDLAGSAQNALRGMVTPSSSTRARGRGRRARSTARARSASATA